MIFGSKGTKLTIFGQTAQEIKALMPITQQAQGSVKGFFSAFDTKNLANQVESQLQNTIQLIDQYNFLKGMGTNPSEIIPQLNQNEGTKKLLQEANGGMISQDAIKEYSTSQRDIISGYQKMSASSKLAALGASALNAVMSAGIMIAVSLAVQALVGWLTKLANASNEAREAAIDSMGTLQQSADQMDSYRQKVIELKSALDSGTLSQEEATSKRRDLINIQQELIDKYGGEAGAIDLVNGKLDEQIDKIDELNGKDYQTWRQDNVKAINDAENYLNKKRNGTITFNGSIHSGLKNTIANVIREFGTISEAEGKSQGYTYVHSTNIAFKDKTSEQIIQYYRSVFDAVEKWGEENSIDVSNYLEIISSEIKKFDTDKLHDYQEIYRQNTEALVFTDSEYRNIYNQIAAAKEELDKGLAEGSQAAMSTALQQFEKIDLSNINDRGVKEYFEELYNSIKDQYSNIEFQATFDKDGTLREFAATIAGLTDDCETLSGTLSKVQQGYSFSKEEIEALTARYPDLKNAISETTDGYRVEETAVQQLYDAKSDELQKSEEASEKHLMGIRSRILNENDSVKQFALAYGVNLDNFNEAERRKLAASIRSHAEILGITEKNVDDKAQEYGIDLSNFVTTEAKKVAVSNAILRTKITATTAQLLIATASGSENQWVLQQEIKNLKNQIIDENTIDNVLRDFDISSESYTPKDPSSPNSGKGASSSPAFTTTSDPTLAAYQKQKSDLDHLRQMDLIGETEYLNQLTALSDKYFKGNKKYEEQYRSNQQEIYRLQQSITKEKISALGDEVSALEKVENSYDRQLTLLQQQQSLINSALEDARKKGISIESDYYKELEKFSQENLEKQKAVVVARLEYELNAFLDELNASKDRIASYKDADHGDISGELMAEEATAAMDKIDARIKKLLQDGVDANDSAIKELRQRYDEFDKSRLEGLQMVLDAQKKQIDDSLTAAKEALQKERQSTEDYWNAEINAYKRKHEAQEKVNTLKEKELQLENLKKQRSVLTYIEGQGFVYTADQEAVDAAQEDLDKTRKEYEYQENLQRMEDAKEKALKAIDDEIEKLNEQQEFWNRYFEDFSLNSKTAQDLHEEWVKNQGEKFLEQTNAIVSYANAYTAQLDRMIERLKELNELETGRNLGTNSSQNKKSSPKGYASGSSYVPRSGTYLVHENGPEAILAPNAGSYEYLPQGSVVFSAAATKNLWNWSKLNPVRMLSASHLPTPAALQTNSISIGEINLNGVQDTDRLSKEIVTRLPLAMQQAFYKR